jgi:hypothetical protein
MTYGWPSLKTPEVTDVVNPCATVANPVVGSAKKFAGNGPIIRSCAFVTDTADVRDHETRRVTLEDADDARVG